MKKHNVKVEYSWQIFISDWWKNKHDYSRKKIRLLDMRVATTKITWYCMNGMKIHITYRQKLGFYQISGILPEAKYLKSGKNLKSIINRLYSNDWWALRFGLVLVRVFHKDWNTCPLYSTYRMALFTLYSTQEIATKQTVHKAMLHLAPIAWNIQWRVGQPWYRAAHFSNLISG